MLLYGGPNGLLRIFINLKYCNYENEFLQVGMCGSLRTYGS